MLRIRRRIDESAGVVSFDLRLPIAKYASRVSLSIFMDTAIKELQKLQKLTEFEPSKPNATISVLSAASLASKSKVTTGVVDSLDGLLASLRDIKERLEAGSASEDDIMAITTTIDERKKEIDDRQKEAYATMGRIGKALDKVRCFLYRGETTV